MSHRVPAEVLSLLDNFQEGDPPVAWEQKCWSPVGAHWEERCSPRAPRPSHISEWDRYRIVLPASNAAIAAVVARHMKGGPDGSVPMLHAVYWLDCIAEPEVFFVGIDGVFWAIPIPEHMLDDATEWDTTLALAHVACWLARVVRVNRNLDANGLPQLETITAHGMELFECEYNLSPLEPTP
jgi:hypothetical protein